MNILRYKQQVRGWMFRGDGDSSTNSMVNSLTSNGYNTNTSGGYSSPQTNTSNNTWSDANGSVTTNGINGNTSWTVGPNGQSSGSIDPNGSGTNTPADQFSTLNSLSAMFNKANPQFGQTNAQLPGVSNSLNQLMSGPIGSEYNNSVTPNQDQTVKDNYNIYGDTTPNAWQKLGMIPGMTSEQFFNKETPAQRDERMGMVSNGIGDVAKAFGSALMPAPVRMAMGAYNAYQGYQADPNHNLGQAVATGASSFPGYVGALGNMYNGNYGSAVSKTLGANGITGMTNTLAGLGTDAATGKDVTASLGGLAGQFAGQSLGGPLGGMFGKSLGQQIARK